MVLFFPVVAHRAPKILISSVLVPPRTFFFYKLDGKDAL